jgi:hypothetical protein
MQHPSPPGTIDYSILIEAEFVRPIEHIFFRAEADYRFIVGRCRLFEQATADVYLSAAGEFQFIARTSSFIGKAAGEDEILQRARLT